VCNVPNTKCQKPEKLLNLPNTTLDGRPTVDLVQSRLRAAWKWKPHIDLYVRAGCQTTYWLIWMLESAEVFFPNFLGEIIVVLDEGDTYATTQVKLFRERSQHRIRLEYLPTPCMVARVFNQMDYLNSYRVSDADYLVTIDSDCVFHTPVLPHLLFMGSKVILPVSAHFQKNMWDEVHKAITGVDLVPPGHSMVTQPVTFRRDTIEKFWGWIERNQNQTLWEVVNTEYERRKGRMPTFNWMAFVSTYAWHEEQEKYAFDRLEQSRTPYRRFAVHTKWEEYGSLRSMYQRSRAATLGGLCSYWPREYRCDPQDRNYVEHYKYRYTAKYKLCLQCTLEDYKKSEKKVERALHTNT
jgi:glycosyltransferase involved in cell wall biosynthesis